MSAPLSPDVHAIVRQTAFFNGVLGVVLSPIPLADELLLFPIFAGMTARIAREKSLPVREVPWRPVLSTTFAALTARAAINVTVSYIPGVAAVANAASAVAMTHWLGRYIDEACDAPDRARAFGVREIADLFKRNATAATAATAT
jgi:uncharacterized protein (DUF697 family)